MFNPRVYEGLKMKSDQLICPQQIVKSIICNYALSKEWVLTSDVNNESVNTEYCP